MIDIQQNLDCSHVFICMSRSDFQKLQTLITLGNCKLQESVDSKPHSQLCNAISSYKLTSVGDNNG